ncbi:NUDIX domain-containing protein [Nocardia sp. NPDC059240]|uniref:NUDIX hydrolase n=1 Tax=Nocardia sp. NPDC059240 TaxID=3346786 RepID=UPI00368AE615
MPMDPEIKPLPIPVRHTRPRVFAAILVHAGVTPPRRPISPASPRRSISAYANGTESAAIVIFLLTPVRVTPLLYRHDPHPADRIRAAHPELGSCGRPARHNAQVEPFRVRVAAYVIRDCNGPQLLVFDHVGMPEAGTQIPAGGVATDESLEQAVLREIAEETGLTDLEVLGPIAVDERPYPHTGAPRRTTYFRVRPRSSVADSWTHRVMGDGEDNGLLFACRFEPLPLTEPLADHQDAWLG